MKVNKTAIKKWIKALRSGKYEQTSGSLQNENGFCCLGVACKITIPKSKLNYQVDYEDLHKSTGLIRGDFPNAQRHAPKWLREINEEFKLITGISLDDLNDFGVTLHMARTMEGLYYDATPDSAQLEVFTFNEIADLLQLVFIEDALKGFTHAQFLDSIRELRITAAIEHG